MASAWGSGVRSYSNGSVYADLDNDGDADLVVNNINETAFIYRNNSEKKPGNHFLSVTLRGKGLNTRGTGATVTLYTGGIKQVLQQDPTRGFLSSVSDVLHFGLGSSDKADSLIIIWPDRSEQRLVNVAANQAIVLDNLNAAKHPLIKDNRDKKLKIFTPATIPGLDYIHREDPWTDFRREHLIPYSLAAEGPALAAGDINGDSLQDLFLGGAKGSHPVLFVQQRDGSFRKPVQSRFTDPNAADDVDAAFFDADNDGDQDLYIVKGGNELPAGHPLLSDKLYINDGRGEYSEADKGLLPLISHNGSCVRPCDFNNDGHVDLFVGSRSLPGAYGISPEQFLLENDGQGHLRNITSGVAPELKNIGMVTDACWADVDGDGDYDLVVTGEWMGICLFRNDNGHFTETGRESGFGDTEGWWSSLKAVDIDNDGDMDLIAGNLGLNSLLKASVKEPVTLYVNDFDNNGSPDPVICSFQDGASFPVASLDEIAAQIKGVAGKFREYSDFGEKTIDDIFGKDIVRQSIIKTAVLFESSIFLNDGKGTFKRVPLPPEAQFSPVRDIVTGDFDHDGYVDIVAAGNDYQVLPLLGRYDASFGWFLKGEPGGTFTAEMPVASGLRIDGDARHIRIINIKGREYLVAAVNNGSARIFKLKPR